MDNHLQEFALSPHIFANIRIFFGLFLVDHFDSHLLASQRVQALFDFGERAFAELSAQQIVAHAFIVRESGDYLLSRDEKVGRYDKIFALDAILVGIVYVIV
jgi:hypothetical protein